MKRVLIVALATILFLFSSASAIDLVFLNQPNPPTNEDFTINMRATSANGVEYIERADGGSPWYCIGDSPCDAKFTFKESTYGQKQYSFRAVESGTYNEIIKTITVTVYQNPNDQPPQQPTTDKAPTISTSIPSSALSNQEFTISSSAADDIEVNRITFTIKDSNGNIIRDSPWYCLASSCVAQPKFSLTNPGTYTVIATAYDSQEQKTANTGTITITLPTELSVKSSYLPLDPRTGEIIEVKISAASNKRITLIERTGGSSPWYCTDDTTCDAKFTFTESNSGMHNYAFRIHLSDLSYKDHIVSINVKEAGSGNDNAPTISASVPILVKTNEEFKIQVITSDDLGIEIVRAVLKDSLNRIMRDTPWYCIGVKNCASTFSFNISTPGTYHLSFVAEDTTGHKTTNTYTFTAADNVGDGGDNDDGNDGGNDGGNNDGGSGGGNTGGGNTGGSGGGAISLASFTTTPSEIWVGEEVTFDASSSKSRSSGAMIKRYQWDLDGDDRDDVDTSSPTTKYVYSKAGTYKVRLYITDNYGISSFIIKSITVKCCRTPSASTLATFDIKTLDKSDAPVGDVLVSIRSQTAVYGVVTKSDGTVQAKVAAGCYNMTAEKSGYAFEPVNNICIDQGQSKSIIIKESHAHEEKGYTGFFSKIADMIRNKPLIVIPIGIIMISSIVALVFYLRTTSIWAKKPEIA